MTQPRPTFRDLTRAEADAVLARNHVGRMAFTDHEQVDIAPISYVYAGGMLHGRTEPGTKLSALAHRPWVALETDEIEGMFRWRSVVARGTFFRLDPELQPREYGETVAAIRQLMPAAFTPDDPTPERDVVIRVDIREVIGRSADDR